ncbi:3-hydroxyacyl-CoA dehydrogenase [Bordetella petrii]|uniref:3-hydroxyacyl-CoA dehydrogenase n=1 Tax=Bordetella petrii (strain ATCC BAA-461 / DSM 12804 / CCUG 43448 / CIP 107267 / Se-1111R) TaxID=340100 RepID=A9HX30_BORPD|nr:3-hydroxyacyl-CoA dehydrogenase [Bordetella petrii]CAP43702.1 putative 3-hydroxyacyl-CoA dehydrogenase [Bordetella petrii]
MSNIAIIGAGLIGRAWAIVFARGGHRVALWDSQPGQAEAALEFAATVLPDLAAQGLLRGQPADQVLARLRVEPHVEAALADAHYVQESTPEVLDSKRAVYAELDRLAPGGAILASSTSALLPSRFTDHLAGRERCLVAHPINPPYLVPAVELVPAPWTSPQAMEQARRLLADAGQVPIMMRREIDGFVMNRLQGALLQEAFRLVADGYAGVEDVDIGLREGLALRWSFMGPFETIDLNAPGGVRDYAERYEGMYAGLFEQMQRRVPWGGELMDRIEAERREHLPADELAARQLWRDRRLMALAAHKQAVGGDPAP